MIPTPDIRLKLYEGALNLSRTVDIRGWHYDEPIFAELIDEVRPKVYVEVGCYLGASMIRVNKLASLAGLDLLSYGVDFWEIDVLYRQFLTNVAMCGYSEQVIPVKGYSVRAAQALQEAGVVADLIYIDAGHDRESCLNDMLAYWPLLREGGVMFGDDYTEERGVHEAVNDFGRKFSHSYYHWRLDPK